jgi:hypothetical protein
MSEFEPAYRGTLYIPDSEHMAREYVQPADHFPRRYQPRDIALPNVGLRPDPVRKEFGRYMPRRTPGVDKRLGDAANGKRKAKGLKAGAVPFRVFELLKQYAGWMTTLDIRTRISISETAVHSAVRDLQGHKLVKARKAEGLTSGAREYATLDTPDDAPVFGVDLRTPKPASSVAQAMRDHGGWLSTHQIVELIADRHPELRACDLCGRMSWLIKQGRVEKKPVEGSLTRMLYRWINTGDQKS